MDFLGEFVIFGEVVRCVIFCCFEVCVCFLKVLLFMVYIFNFCFLIKFGIIRFVNILYVFL